MHKQIFSVHHWTILFVGVDRDRCTTQNKQPAKGPSPGKSSLHTRFLSSEPARVAEIPLI